MSNLTVTIPHKLTRGEAKRRIQEQIAGLRRQHGSMFSDIKETWQDDRLDFSLTAMSQTVSGHLTIDDTAVHLEVVLPWLLNMLAGKVKSSIEQQGRLLLGNSPHKPGNVPKPG